MSATSAVSEPVEWEAEDRVRVARRVDLLVLSTNRASEAVPFLLVHGLASNARLWGGVAARLAERGHPVAAVDQRGHGQSAKPDAGYDFATLSADLVAVIEAIGWGGRRPLAAGQSWGGNVVLELAVRHPRVTRAVACVDGGTIELADRFPTWAATRLALVPPNLAGVRAAEFEAMIRSLHPDWPETSTQGMLANVEVRPDGTVAPWLSLEHHMTILHHLWEHRPSQRYRLVPVPVLLVPADDARSPWMAGKRGEIARAEAALPLVRTRWFSPGDHDLHAQDPIRLADLLHDATGVSFFE